MAEGGVLYRECNWCENVIFGNVNCWVISTVGTKCLQAGCLVIVS